MRALQALGLAAGLIASIAAQAGEPLKVVGRHDVMEVGPVLYAIQQAGPDIAVFASGGVDNLFKVEGAAPAGGFDHAPGTADLAAQAETQALRASVANPDLRIILTVTEGLYRVVARRSAGIATAEDLRGKRIGVFERTSAAYFLDRLLARAGVAAGEVTLVPLRPREMEPALTTRKVDAVAIWEPESERSMMALGDDAVSLSDPTIYRELYNLNTTAQALADPVRRARIVDFVRRLVTAARVCVQEPEKVWPLVAASSLYPQDLVAASWHHHRFPAGLPGDLLDVMVDEEKWLAAQANRPARDRAQLEKLIDRSVLREAMAP
ncbi:ABC transporter substrate-binding protein [Niveispirillum sp. KHB5.9]|uniref:ABC transporter substrate-binding protein n=1 Tax=Niveispirillum sp. KHB5.9 TaxID=3400269 RepID=UPI003A8530C4